MSIHESVRSGSAIAGGKNPVTARRGQVALMLTTPGDERFWRTALASQGVPSVDANLRRTALGHVLQDGSMASAAALIVDLPIVCAAGLTLERLAAQVIRGYPGLSLFVRMSWRVAISAAEQAWAKRLGIAAVLPGSTAADWSASLAPALASVLSHIGHPGVDVSGLGRFLRVLVANGEEPRSGPVKDAFVAAYRLEMQGLDASELLRSMRGPHGVAQFDRTYRGASYRRCFVASEALDWLEKSRGLSREIALVFGQYLWGTGRIHHVVRDQAFDDANFFFRFAGDEARLDRVDLAVLEADMRGRRGLDISARSYLGKIYPGSFVGRDAVDWLMRRHALDVGQAEAVGQRLLDLGVIHHVTDEHGFSDAHYFYRFRNPPKSGVGGNRPIPHRKSFGTPRERRIG